MDANTRYRLYEIYGKLDELVNELSGIMRIDCKSEYPRAKAYWLASLSSGLSNEEYCTLNPTFASFLKDAGIVNDDGEFIEEEEDEEEEGDEHEIDEIY